MQQNYKNTIGTGFFPSLQRSKEKILNQALLLGAMATLLHSLSTRNSSTLSWSGFAPLKPKDNTGRKCLKAVIQTSLLYRMAMYPTRNLQVNR